MANQVLGMELADWAILGFYVVVMVSVGFWSATKVKNGADFFMGGRRFGKILTTFFAFGCSTSGGQAANVAAGTWRTGITNIWWQFLWLPIIPFYWLIAPLLRRLRAVTTADIFGNRFSPSVAVLYSVYGMIFSVVLIAGALYGSGKMINSLTGNRLDEIVAPLDIRVPSVTLKWVGVDDVAVPNDEKKMKLTVSVSERRPQGHEIAIAFMAMLFVVYSMAGGLVAVITTDFIQGALTIVFSILLLPFVFSKVAELGAADNAASLKPGLFDFMTSQQMASALGQEPITLFSMVMLMIAALLGIIVQPHVMGVCGAAKNESEARLGFTVGNFLKQLCTMAWAVIGLACVAWYLSSAGPLATSTDPADQAIYQDLQNRVSADFEQLPAEEANRIDSVDRKFADELFGRAAYDILSAMSPGLVGLLLVGLLASVMSTSDVYLVMSSGLFVETIYKRFVAPFRSEMHYVWVGRIVGALIVLSAIVMQTFFIDILHAIKVIIKTPAIIGVSLWFGLFWKRWNPTSVWVSTIVGSSVWFYVSHYGVVLHQRVLPVDSMYVFVDGVPELADAWQILFFLTATIVSGVFAAMVTQQQSPMQLDRFYTLLQTPIEPGENVIIPCRVPENSTRRNPVIEIGDWVFLKPTASGMLGFGLSWLAVLAIIGITWGLSAII